MLELITYEVNRDGAIYNDLVLRWLHDGKEYVVRVRPCFTKDYRLLMAFATKQDTNLDTTK